MPSAILRAVVSADTGVATAKLAAFGHQVDTIGKTGTASLSRLQIAGGVAFAAIGVAAIAGIGKAINTTVRLGGETRTLSRQLGLTAQDASKLRVAAETLGISTDDLTRGFGIFSKHLVDGGKAFEKYGITLKNTNGTNKDFNTVLGETADKYRSLAPGIERTAFVLDTFGRSGKTLIPLLAQGSAGIKKLGDEAQRLGLVMSEKDIKQTRELAIAQRQLHEAFQGVEVSLARGFLPILKDTAVVLTTAVTLFNKLPGPVKSLGTAAIGLGGAFVGVGLSLRVLRVALAGFTGEAVAATAATEGLAAAEGTAAAATGGAGIAGALGAVAAPLAVVAGLYFLTADRAKKQAEEVAAARKEIENTTAGTPEHVAALHKLATAQGDLSSKAVISRRSLDSEKGSLDHVGSSTHDMTAKTWAASGAIHDLTAKTNAWGGAIDDASPKIGIMAGSLGTIAGEARTAAAMVAALLNNWRNLAASPTPVFGKVLRKQHGMDAMVTDPTVLLVGEAGPEHVKVTPQGGGGGGATPQGGGGGSGPETIIIKIDSHEVARVIRRRQLLRSGG